MPVGFENSAMKMSFSLSSLQPSSGSLESPEHARLRAERPYNSLTKKSRRDPEQETWRHSWGSREDNKDEFWAVLQSNYDYLMDNNLIESCKEASGDLSWDEGDVAETYTWSFNEFTNQFSELYSWLNSIHEAVYGKEENITDRSLRVSHMEEMQRKAYRRKLFNEQSSKLLRRYPNMHDEVSRKVAHLNSKWEMLEQAITPCKSDPDKLDPCTDVEHEMRCLRCLRKWIHEMEGRLKPLNLRAGVGSGLQELEDKAKEHLVLQRDVASHHKIVCSIVKRCELNVKTDPSTPHAHCVPHNLERRWLQLCLRSLEWQYHIEALLNKLRNPSPSGAYSESDEEPVSKYPRLCSGGDLSDRLTDDGSYFEDGLEELCVMDTSPEPSIVHSADESDSDNMVGKQRHSSLSPADTNGGVDVNDNCKPTRRRRSAPTSSVKGLPEDSSSFYRSNRKARNFATFYFKHLDTDSEQDIARGRMAKGLGSGGSISEMKSVEESSEEDEDEWTYTCGSASPQQQNRRSEGSGSSSETMSSVRGQSQPQKPSVVVRLDFGGATDTGSSNNLDVNMLVNNECANNGQAVHSSPRNGEASNSKNSPARKLSRNSKESIQRLVSRAEELVREEQSTDKMAAVMRAARVFEPLVFGGEGKVPSGTQAKYSRIKEWLKLHLQENGEGKLQQPLDSCDASGEYTTGDSDEDKESQSSEDHNGSVTTCRHLELILGCGSPLGSAEAILDPDATPVAEKNLPNMGSTSPEHSGTKVMMRSKRRQTVGERPWSVSGISQLGTCTPQTKEQPLSQFSISESALHQMLTTSSSNKGRALSNSNGGVHGNLSSSTIDEATLQAAEGSGSRTGSLRRRKVRMRKRTIGRKSESGSDGVTVGHSGSSDTQQQLSPQKPGHKSRSSSGAEGSPRTLTKSGSFSGTTSVVRRLSERCTASDPAMSLRRNKCDTTSETGTETEEERRVARQRLLPLFRLGPDLGVVTCSVGATRGEGDSDMEKNSAQGAEEQLSSFSEQAWDNYQEKYMSEPYSEELADSETARRLLEFGDDYRNFLDSQSDCASSLSANHVPSPVRKRKPIGPIESPLLDSDSDLEDIRHLIHQSHSQLVFSEQVLSKQLSKASPEMILASDFAEIVATCRENLRCLRVILDNVEEDGGPLSTKEYKEITGLVEGWDLLQAKTEDSQRVRCLQREMSALRDELLHLAARVATVGSDLKNRDELENRIEQVKADLASLRDRKSQLLQVNVAVHRYLTVPPGHSASTLKDDVADLYRVWDETIQGVQLQLENLQWASQTWQQFEAHLTELQVSLRGDHNTLRLISSALQGGAVSPDVATSVRDVAKVLSEKPDLDQETLCQMDANSAALSPLSTEGSLSDSGISDSGSERELSERERRLAALRRLARHLEAVLAPGSAARLDMDKRLEQTESKLRGLQHDCRDLILRTAVCVEARKQNTPTPLPPRAMSPGPRPHSAPSRRKKSREAVASGGGGPEDPEPGKQKPGRPWLWRVVRAALPFQMVLLALFCVAWLLEPHCCEAINNLHLSLTPTLSYFRPPPV